MQLITTNDCNYNRYVKIKGNTGLRDRGKEQGGSFQGQQKGPCDGTIPLVYTRTEMEITQIYTCDITVLN